MSQVVLIPVEEQEVHAFKKMLKVYLQETLSTSKEQETIDYLTHNDFEYPHIEDLILANLTFWIQVDNERCGLIILGVREVVETQQVEETKIQNEQNIQETQETQETQKKQDKKPLEIRISEIYLNKSKRNQGIGTKAIKFLKKLIQRAFKDKTITLIANTAKKNQKAHKFFAKQTQNHTHKQNYTTFTIQTEQETEKSL